MKVSRQALYSVLNGTAAVTAEMALRFARLTGGVPELYLNMQTGHDLEAAQQRLQDELDDIEPGPKDHPSAAISAGNKRDYVVETTGRSVVMRRNPKRRADPPDGCVAPERRPARLRTTRSTVSTAMPSRCGNTATACSPLTPHRRPTERRLEARFTFD
jgi:hypothetical protein